MTIREFYLSVINGTIDADTVAKASELLGALDDRNAKRKSAESKEKVAVRERRDAVLATLSDDCPLVADDIVNATNLSVGQVRAALASLVRDGFADKVEVKVGKSKRMAYIVHTESV